MRRGFVQTLLRRARESESGLEKIADRAGKTRVEEFAGKLLASDKLDADGKTEATGAALAQAALAQALLVACVGNFSFHAGKCNK